MGGQRGRQQGLVRGQGRPAVKLQDQRLDVRLVQPPLRAALGTRDSAAPPTGVCNIFQSGESAVWHQTVVSYQQPCREGLPIDTHIKTDTCIAESLTLPARGWADIAIMKQISCRSQGKKISFVCSRNTKVASEQEASNISTRLHTCCRHGGRDLVRLWWRAHSGCISARSSARCASRSITLSSSAVLWSCMQRHDGSAHAS